MTHTPHERRLKAILQGMRRAEQRKADALVATRDMLSLIDGAAYGTREEAQRTLDWLAAEGILPALDDADLRNVGEALCVAWNGCGADPQALLRWLNAPGVAGAHPRVQALRKGDSAKLLAAAHAAFPR